ncbi:hypothetical protein Pcinc_009470 [Petrolisthes cinctipes]|uniref:ARF GTPase-activating protein GIT2 n=1 Tax=Petrolisthes cinctipes TaxID=88211 RepID=A0AAE1G7C2_PETCI|nr:hypothetical protein Pcinc_009470 [Petrolisthes cinctipes]
MTLPNSPKISSNNNNLHLHNNNNNININARLITPPNSATFPPSSSSNTPSSPHLINKDPRQQVNSLTSLSSNTTADSLNAPITNTSNTSDNNTSVTNTGNDISGPSSLNSYFSSNHTHHHHHHLHHQHHHTTPTLTQLTSTTNTTTTTTTKGEVTDDGEPLYDSVASEDDYTYVEQMQKLALQKQILEEQQRQHQLEELYSEPTSDCGPTSMESAVSLETFLEMKEQRDSRQALVEELKHNNAHMRSRLDELAHTVKNLQEENKSLRSMYSSSSGGSGVVGGGSPGPPPPSSSSSLSSTLPPPPHPHPSHPPSLYSTLACVYNGESDPKVNLRCSRNAPQRPFSMFEPRQGPPNLPSTCPTIDQTRSSAFHVPNVRMSGEYDNTRTRSPSLEASETTPLNTAYGLPTQEEVVKKTEVITKRIQELLISAQEGRQDDFMPCADHIHSAVLDMDAIFPKGQGGAGVQGALRQLVSSAGRLHSECRTHLLSPSHSKDLAFVTQQVIQCAYDIAKGAKLLVTHFQ